MASDRIIINHQLTNKGLSYTVSEDSIEMTVSHDPKATCELFKKMGFIEGFELDNEGMPIVKVVNKKFPSGFGCCSWNEFSKIGINEYIIKLIIEYKEQAARYKNVRSLLLHFLKDVVQAA